MITQDVKNPKLQGMGGILVILAILLAIFLALVLSAVLRPFAGALISTIFVWLAGGAVALYVMRRYVVKFRYSMDARRIRIERVYGDRARFMLEFPLNCIVKMGSIEEMRAAYPSARKDNAMLRDVPIRPVAIAYKQEGAVRLLLLQPNEQIHERLLSALKNA